MIRPARVPTTAEIADHYDELDRFYREVWGEHVHHGLWVSGFETPELAVRLLVRLVADRARIGRGDRVCDVGCGYGAPARLLAKERAARVVGITLSPTQHGHALARAVGEGASFLLGDWLSNDLRDRSFDAVIAIESVEHMADKRACFAEAYRVLRPGKRFVFTTWLAGEDVRDWERCRLLEPICREGRLPGIGTASEHRRLLAEAGFSRVLHEDLTPRVKRTWSVCASRLAARLAGDSRYRRFVLSHASRNRVFALTLARMWLAYETGAMRYGLFSCERNGGEPDDWPPPTTHLQ